MDLEFATTITGEVLLYALKHGTPPTEAEILRLIKASPLKTDTPRKFAMRAFSYESVFDYVNNILSKCPPAYPPSDGEKLTNGLIMMTVAEWGQNTPSGVKFGVEQLAEDDDPTGAPRPIVLAAITLSN